MTTAGKPKNKTNAASDFVYVFVGENTPVVDDMVAQVVDKLLSPEQKTTGLLKIDSKETSIVEVLDELRTLPFLTSKRVVVIKDADKFVSENRSLLESYFQNPAPTSVLILTVSTWPSNTRLAKLLTNCGSLQAVPQLKDCQLPSYLIKYAAQIHKKTLAPDAAKLIVELTGDEIAILQKEVDKLIIYTEGKKQITIDDVLSLSGSCRLFDAFEVIDSCLAGQVGPAVDRLRRMLESDSSAEYSIVGAFAWQLRKMFKAKVMLDKGSRPDEISKSVGIWYNKDAFFNRVRSLSLDRIAGLLKNLGQVDYDMKTGGTTASIAMEQIVLTLASSPA